MEQDIRIISMKTLGNNDVKFGSDNSFQSFVYVNKIDVIKVEQNDSASLLKNSYECLREAIKREETKNQSYQTQQTMVVFSEIDDNLFTRERIEAFWLAKKALLFVTMVNIPICGYKNKSARECLLSTKERINEIFKGKDYLLYYTLEYNEIMLFYHGTDFKEYYQLVMRLNHEKLSNNDENYIIDTITLCGFGEGANNINDKTVGAFIKFGFNDCNQALVFLKENNLVSSNKSHLYGLLGRKDIAIFLEEITISQLYKLLHSIEKQKLVTTLSMTLLTSADIVESLQGNNLDINSIKDENWIGDLKECTSRLKKSYIHFCNNNKMQIDNVFLRMVDSISSLIASSRQGRLAEDLAVCLWFPFKHFSEFMCGLSELDLSNHFDWELEFQQCLDVFCQNAILIENSTIHTNRQFVQIPHYESIAFEMPPKVMAYYTLITQKLLDAFKDKHIKTRCGAMLAPHLVNELEVEPILRNDSIEPLQFIVVNISEEMLYDPQRTVAILGHEIAHFAGNETRCRETRRKCIYIYYIYNLLKEFVKKYMNQISAEICEKDIDVAYIFEVANKFADTIINNGTNNHSLKKCPLNRELIREISDLKNKLFSGLEPDVDVFESIIKSNNRTLFSEYISKAYCEEMLDDKYIDKLADNFALNSINTMNIIDRFDETRYKEMEDYEKRVSYLFSETYSDLAMIKVFNISKKDYFNLYRKDLTTYPLVNDTKSTLCEITLLRFLTVCAVAYRTDNMCDVAENINEEIDEILAEACRISNDTNKISEFAEKYQLDEMLMKMLYEYLKTCNDALGTALDKSEAVKCLQNEYQWLSQNNHTVMDFLMQILNMEKDYAND